MPVGGIARCGAEEVHLQHTDSGSEQPEFRTRVSSHKVVEI
jgi:hypothetical protein